MKMYLSEYPQTDIDEVLAESPSPENLLSLLNAEKMDKTALADRLSTLKYFTCPALHLAGQHSALGGKSFFYQFTKVRNGAGKIGAYHGAEIPYVFNSHDYWLPTDASDHKLTDEMMTYWVNFARSGDPNDARLPAWAPLTPTTVSLQELGEKTGTVASNLPELCRLINKESK